MNTFILIVLGQIVSLFGNAALRFALPSAWTRPFTRCRRLVSI